MTPPFGYPLASADAAKNGSGVEPEEPLAGEDGARAASIFKVASKKMKPVSAYTSGALRQG